MGVSWRALAWVAAGGTIGTLIRAALEGAFPAAPGAVPWTTLVINVTGAFVLGLLLESLALRGPDAGRRRDLRFFLGTGLLGGYTTYSTFAVETLQRFDPASLVVGLGYAVTSVGLGLLAVAGGFGLARHQRRPGVNE